MFHFPTSSTRSRYFLLLPLIAVAQSALIQVARSDISSGPSKAAPKSMAQIASPNTVPAKATNVLAPIDARNLLFRGENLPVPPQQNAPWKARTDDFENNFVSATSKLFEQGLSDPRGCEYREMEIVTNNDKQESKITRTRGWVLPADKNSPSSTRFAVGWNGLVYPLLSVGGKADLQADVTTILKNNAAMRAKELTAEGRKTLYLHRSVTGENWSVDSDSLLPIKASLLLRLGESENARKLWDAYTQVLRKTDRSSRDFGRDAYLMLATDWIWARFDRMLQARTRGDDKLALIDARLLQTQHAAVEAEAAKRGYSEEVMMRRNNTINYTTGKLMPGLYLSFLEGLPRYLADVERRVKENNPPPSSLNPAVAQKATTAQLIAMLDQGKAWDFLNGGDATGVKTELVNRGDEAVEPLLRVLESDTRLTRGMFSSWLRRGPIGEDYERSPISTAEVALDILTQILRVTLADNHEIRDESKRPQTVARIRAQWDELKNLSREERWFEILGDNNAPHRQWIEAAGNIVAPVVSADPRTPYGADMAPYQYISNIPTWKAKNEKMQGESLRGKTQPSVTYLISQRMAQRELENSRYRTNNNIDGEATQFALFLSRWDSKAALPILQARMARYRTLADSAGAKSVLDNSALPTLGKLTIARVEAGDEAALIEYSKWARSVSDWRHVSYTAGAYAPLWLYPQNKEMQQLTKWLLEDPESLWPSVFNRQDENWNYHLLDLLTTRLLGVPLVRERVLRGLNDRTGIGAAIATKSDKPEQNVKVLRLDISSSTGFNSLDNDSGVLPPAAWKIPLRVCDFYAVAVVQWRSKNAEKAPQFELYRTLAERDATIQKIADFVRAYSLNSRDTSLQ